MDTTEKYRDKVTPEFELAMQAIAMSRRMLLQSRETFKELVDANDRMGSMGIVLDPTLYRDMLRSQNFKDSVTLTKAAITFLSATDDVFTRAEAAARKAQETTCTERSES